MNMFEPYIGLHNPIIEVLCSATSSVSHGTRTFGLEVRTITCLYSLSSLDIWISMKSLYNLFGSLGFLCAFSAYYVCTYDYEHFPL